MHPELLSEAIEPFIDDRLIDSLLYPVKSGKEGVLYCATAGPRVAADLVAVKVYKPQKYRSFRDDSMYRSGRAILNQRSARAAAKQTRFGREVRALLWTDSEYQTLRILHRAGAQVPKPLGHTSGAVVMEWIGDMEGPAPQLKEVKLDQSEAATLFEALIANIELWLACNIVHADLSAYNLLYHAGRLIAIDFPQAIDPRSNLHAPSLLARDLGNVSQYFARFGVECDPNALADDMWDRFIRGCL